MMDYTLNCRGRLLSLAMPQVMGILNATPDSFYAASRQQTERAVAVRTEEILSQGGSIIDVGACSTRPGSEAVNEEEEIHRLRQALAVVRRIAPDAVVSIDTFRPAVARIAVEEFGADIINDVGAPANSPRNATLSKREQPIANSQQPMFRMVSRLHVPYIYMSRGATIKEVLMDCAEAVAQLRALGQCDIVLDPGFGFGKDLHANYEVLSSMEQMHMLALPILVGVSRKSMIWRLLGSNPEEALNGTTVLNTIALMKGASLLRVHDVREAVECVKIVNSQIIK